MAKKKYVMVLRKYNEDKDSLWMFEADDFRLTGKHSYGDLFKDHKIVTDGEYNHKEKVFHGSDNKLYKIYSDRSANIITLDELNKENKEREKLEAIKKEMLQKIKVM
jgi:hypothetical protein